MPKLNLRGIGSPRPSSNRHRSAVVAPRVPLPVPAATTLFTGMVDRTGRPIGLQNIYLDATLFMVLSGPSLRTLDLTLLNQRGVTTMGVNNSPCMVRTKLWTYGDESLKFHSAIFRDPDILKFVPEPKLTDRVREKIKGRFRTTGQQVNTMPGVVGIYRNSDFRPDQWLWEPTFNWGNGEEYAARNGLPSTLSTMIQAMKLAFYLGFRKVHLLGCDFTMLPGRPYAFDQAKSAGAAASNNRSYRSIDMLFHTLVPHFREARFQVYNCNPKSGLTAFPKASYEEAIREATKGCQGIEDTAGWYEKNQGSITQQDPAPVNGPQAAAG
jgi:hypothetical protein